MQKLILESAVIEITRRCNMVCGHCLRGEMQNCDISDKILYKFFKQIDSIRMLTITGGEPSLATDRIRAIIRIARECHVDIDSFYCCTNGKRVTQDYMNALEELFDYCDSNSESWINVSRDDYHDASSRSGVSKLIDWWVNLAKEAVSDTWGIEQFEDTVFKKNVTMINMGYNQGMGRDVKIHKYEIEDEVEGILYIHGMVYVNCKGDILPHCDLSYELQDEPELIVCSVDDDIISGLRKWQTRKIKGSYSGIEVIN